MESYIWKFRIPITAKEHADFLFVLSVGPAHRNHLEQTKKETVWG